ncbi:RINT-1/TIP-20 [Melampsora americana]|nr:RINT-1/TIP-20 [Melampsora americana]
MINLSPKKPINLDYRMVWCPLPNLIAMKSIVKPLELRFRYHFDSQRSTNRLDKPEWYFDHILHRLEEHERFVRGDVQRLMDMNGYGHLDAMTQFSILLIEMIEKKLKQTIPQILEIKPLLAHTIYKAIEFDTSIKERGFQPIQSSDSSKDEAWLGTTEVILGNEEWFEVWFEAEKKFFEENGSEIMNSTDTWIIETEEPRVIEKGIKTTVSALKIEEQITEMKHRIERLSKIEYQLRFLIELQLKLIKEYHAKISNVLNAFESQFGHIGLIRSSVPVGGNENGEVGTLKLVKVYVSLEWMLGVFKEWSDDLVSLSFIFQN